MVENNELHKDEGVTLDKNTQINLVVNNNDDINEINFGRVFHTMWSKRLFYGWIVALCLLIGVSVPLIVYQFTKEPLTVFSVVTLNYEVDNDEKVLEKDPEAPKRIKVKDLTAPDGEELDLNEITSSYVLQNALNGLELSQPITLSNLRTNINITRTLSEESSRQQEILAQMIENKSEDAYKQMADAEMIYTNTFVVSLSNGFGDEDSRVKVELKDNELRQLLDRILISYNEYLVKTYADKKVPDDAVSVIDIDELDIPESIDQLRAAVKGLYNYCDEKPEEIKDYRSWKTGYSIHNLMARLKTVQEVDIEYLSANVYANGIARDRGEVIDNYRYNLLVAQSEMEQIKENISAVKTLLDNYKNDEILVSVPESNELQTAQTNTEYYNNLILEQADNYKLLAEKEEEIKEYQTRIAALNLAADTVTEKDTVEAQEELQRTLENCQNISQMVNEHMEEIFNSSFFNTLAYHSTALGKTPNFIVASAKKIMIGGLAGIFIGLLIWLIGGLAPEFAYSPEEDDKKKKKKEGKGDDRS